MALNKSTFFRDLDDLDYTSDDALTETLRSKDSVDTTPVLKLSGASKSTRSPLPSKASENDNMAKQSSTGTSNLQEKHNESTKKRRVEAPQSARSKKRQATSFQRIAESKQIFKGLRFFFIPNNSIAPDRKLRIQRSQEYGASWAQAWSADITHVIVDRGLDYKEVLKVLTPEQLSVSII
jgi:DNA polymerase IV